jgi:hypothetical protein
MFHWWQDGILMSGQIPLSAEEEAEVNGMREDVQKAYDEEIKESNKSWWQKAGEFALDMVPIVGPIVSLAKKVSDGNFGMAGLDVVFLAIDVVGIVGAPFSGGLSLAATIAAKAGLRATVKGVLKASAKKMGKESIQAGIKKAGNILSKLGVRELTRGAVCVFACFPAGTPVAVKDGYKNIEDIQVDDEVWAYDEVNDKVYLKKVISTLQRQAHALVELTLEGETIYTTPEHPFFVDRNWKEAGLLEINDRVQLFNSKYASVESVRFSHEYAKAEVLHVNETHDLLDVGSVEDTKHSTVYNLEVDGFGTHFVGWIKALVHNVRICLLEAAKLGEKWAIDILRGIAFYKTMNKQMIELANEKGLKYFSETWLKKGKKLFARVDGYIPGKAIIERKSTDLAKVEIDTAKKYIDQLAKKYKEGTKIANPIKGNTLKGQKILQVQNKKGAPQEVLDYAAENDVKIIETCEEIFKLLKL